MNSRTWLRATVELFVIVGCSTREGTLDPGSGGGNAAEGAAGDSGTAGASATGGSGGAAGGAGGSGGAAGTGAAAGATGGEGGSAGSAGSGGSGAGSGAAGSAGAAGSTGCGALEEFGPGNLCIAKSVQVPAGYAIDSTEVTRSQYEAWLATGPSASAQASWCSWNTTFIPDPGCAGASVCQGSGCGSHPVVCVDWCDAVAYCSAVGKRLCGKTGGGPNGYADHANAGLSQWYKACTSDALNDFPYSDAYDATACNGADYGAGTTVEVATATGCASPVAGYTGVYDMSGNVWEWEDSCDGHSGSVDPCRVRGGAFNMGQALLRCDYPNTWPRGDDLDHLGFRCCSS